MKIDFLGYDRTQTSLIKFIEEFGHTVNEIEEKVADLSSADLVISFGYRHILRDKVIKTAKRPILNLHIAYLPFNRGAHPNFWSWVDETPSGVSVHEIDPGIDTGPIVAQSHAKNVNANMTFSETYSCLIDQMEELFKENAEDIFSGNYEAVPQIGEGTYHAVKDLPKWMTSWDVRISDTIDEYQKRV